MIPSTWDDQRLEENSQMRELLYTNNIQEC